MHADACRRLAAQGRALYTGSSLFGGPLSTRAACVNTAALQRLRQQAEEERIKAEQKRLKALGLPAVGGGGKGKSATPPPPPPKDPVKERKEKLKSALNDFDDLNADGPAKPKEAKPKVKENNGSSGTKGEGSRSGTGSVGPAGSAPPRKHGRPLQTVKQKAHSPSPPPGQVPVAGDGRKGPRGPAGGPTSLLPEAGRVPPSGTGAGPRAAHGPGGAGLTLGQGHQRQAGTSSRAGVGAPPAGRGMPPPGRMGGVRQGLGKPVGRPMGRSRPRDAYDDDEYEDDFVVDEEEEEEDWRQEIRRLTGYDPRRFHDDRDDDRSMEVGWRQITAEEKRSERLGRLEDQLEEEREAERLAAKSKAKKPRIL